MHRSGLPWREIGAVYGISGGLALRIARDGYEPKGAAIRTRLALPVYVPAPACPDCGKAHTIDGVCTAGKAVTVTVTDAPGEMRIRRRPPRKPKPAPDPIWAGITFPCRDADWGPQPGPVVDLDPRAEAIRLALAVLGGHGWTDEQLARAGVALAGVLQSQ